MPRAGMTARALLVRFIAVAAAVPLATGCPTKMKPPETRPVEVVEPPPCDCSRFEAELERLKREVRDPADTRQYEDQIAALRLGLLEKNALAKALQEQLAAQQVELEEAIGEVVRSKAKFRSLESRAQAASDMAEGEIALKTVKARCEGTECPALVPLAEQLLAMSAREFEKQNYGGALYLANQARTKVRAAEVQARVRGAGGLLSGEVPFASPLSLKVAKASRLRKSPGLDADVLATLQPGTPVTGLSHRGEWVHVECADRSRGWVFQSLLSGLE
jgi:hypothetical protein